MLCMKKGLLEGGVVRGLEALMPLHRIRGASLAWRELVQESELAAGCVVRFDAEVLRISYGLNIRTHADADGKVHGVDSDGDVVVCRLSPVGVAGLDFEFATYLFRRETLVGKACLRDAG